MDHDFLVALLMALAGLLILIFAGGFLLLAFRPWFRSFLYGTPVTVTSILAMRLRGNPPRLLVDAYIALRRAGVLVTIADVENAYIDSRSRVHTSDDLVEIVKGQSGFGGRRQYG